MIIAITVIAGLLILTIQIIVHEFNEQIRKIKNEIEPLMKDGGMYPKAKPVQMPGLSRTIYIKPAPLYHVIKR